MKVYSLLLWLDDIHSQAIFEYLFVFGVVFGSSAVFHRMEFIT